MKNKFHFVRILPLKVLGVIEENLKFLSLKSRRPTSALRPTSLGDKHSGALSLGITKVENCGSLLRLSTFCMCFYV